MSGRLHPSLALLISCMLTSAAQPRTPNVVIFYADDMGIGDVGAYGCKDIRTPHIDALAKAGVRFTNYYSAAPICSPSRAALLTGRYPIRCGVPTNVGSIPGFTDGLPAAEITLGELARSRSYATALIGKWHQGYPDELRPNAQGFEYFFGFLAGCIDYYSHMFYWHEPHNHDLWRNGEELHLEGRYMTEMIAEEAGRFIDANHERPFLLYVPFNAPHYPMQAPARYLEPYAALEPNRRVYAAMVSAMDEAIGSIMARLRAHDLTRDTLVFFASDNGSTLEKRANGGGGSNAPYRGHKFSLFDGGIHLPAIVSWPGRIPEGQTRDQLVCAIDVWPTVAEVIGAALPTDRKIDGRSWLPLLRAASAPGHDVLFWKQGPQGAVRKGRWKLVLNAGPRGAGGRLAESAEKDAVFLSDLFKDPGEQRNLRDQHPEIVQELQSLYQSWFADVQAPVASRAD